MSKSENTYVERVYQNFPQKRINTKNQYEEPVIDTEIWFMLPYLVQKLYCYIKGHKYVYLLAWTENIYNIIKSSW